MAGYRESLKTIQKENAVITDTSNNISFVESGEKYDIKNYNLCSTVKSYARHDLLNLRNAQLSIDYPQCALRPELQALPIWTCRLRCELQCLGLWKISIEGNLYGNCNGSCQSYARGGQHYPFSNSRGYAGYSHLCHGSPDQPQKVQLLQICSSPTLGNKKPLRSREPFLNYQRCINTESTSATSLIGGIEDSLQQNFNYVKSPFIDRRSISSSHLMPAFAKRRMGYANALQLQSQLHSVPQYIIDHGQNGEQLHNDDVSIESSSHFETSTKYRKESVKMTHNRNECKLYEGSVNSHWYKSDQFVDNQPGCVNTVEKIDSELSAENKVIISGCVNKKLNYERRIGSGRLCVPREVNWDVTTVTNKQIEKKPSNIVNIIGEKYKNISAVELDKATNCNSSIGRHSDERSHERRVFDRRISSGSESLNNKSCNRTKTFPTISHGEERNNFDSNYHQQTSHFIGQRSMSFRRHETADIRDLHRNFKTNDALEFREKREHGEDKHYLHNHHRNTKEEPEWFSEGPSSQHDTIELRGFDEIDSQQQEQLSKIEADYSDTSLLSLPVSSNSTSRTNDNIDNSRELSNNLSNTTITHNKDINVDDTSGSRNSMEIMPNKETETKLQTFEDSNEQHSNATELFFDNFLSGKIQSSANNDSGGTSRFSRFFFGGTSNNLSVNDEYNNETLNEEDSKQLNEDLNESEFISFMSFLKCNNFSLPELTKGLPSNVSALNVEELEASMMNSSKVESGKSSDNDKHLHKSGYFRCAREYNASLLSTEINTQEVQTFRKLLEQLGKPRVDTGTSSCVLPNTQGLQQSLKTQLDGYNKTATPLQPYNSLKLMHDKQQIVHHHQNLGSMVPYYSKFNHPNHSSGTQIPPQQPNGNMPLMSVSHQNYPHNMQIVLGNSKKRLDVQHLIQSVVRKELSCSFLEKELKNPNTPTYTKEIISTVLKETCYNFTLSGGHNMPASTQTACNNDTNSAFKAPTKSLGRCEASLNLMEHEFNKLISYNVVTETSTSSGLKEISRDGTPVIPYLNFAMPTTGSGKVAVSTQVAFAQNQNLVLLNDRASSDQQNHPATPTMCRSHHHEDCPHIPTQRELQMQNQAMMENTFLKKKMHIQQHKILRRRQEIHKQHELEASIVSRQNQRQALSSNSTISQLGHRQSSRHVSSPTPLTFTPTSVLRKMTAEKETIANSTQAATNTFSLPQQIKPLI